MKTLRTAITAIIALLAVSISAEAQNAIRIKADKVSRQLVEKWITAYKTLHPEMCISIVNKNEEADLTLVKERSNGNITYVGRYAIVPVTSVENPLYGEVAKRQWSNKELKKLFFQTDEDLFEEEGRKNKTDKLADRLTVYSGNNATSAASVFARHFGYEKADIKGKRIAGDDLYLNNAIAKDKQSVTFNNLAYLYDVNSRLLKQDLALIPLNVKKEQQETLASGNLDRTLELLEKQSIESIPVESIGFVHNTFNAGIDNFLTWIVTEGQQYNHTQGFLRINDQDAKKQLSLLANR